MDDIAKLVSQYGFPIISAFGMGYLIFYIWTWVTKEIRPILKETEQIMVALVDRVRMLDNDLIRLQQKVDTVLQLRPKLIEHSRLAKEQKDSAQ